MADDVEFPMPHEWWPHGHQRPLWDFLIGGGKRAIAIWHRRSGKDAVMLNFMATMAMQKKATYWYLLPMQRQARRVIWEAIDPALSLRRMDQAFPKGIRNRIHEQEMSIELHNGSMIHLLGSDNYDSLVGSPPYGVVYSEWALAKPASWGFIRPILRQNGGWAAFVTTPRGENHAWQMFQAAQKHPDVWFAERLAADQTNVFSQEDLEEEHQEYLEQFGLEDGQALFEQEYLCSFSTAVRGSYYGAEIAKADEDGRVVHGGLHPVPGFPVHCSWDIGVDNATAMWFFQPLPDRILWLHYLEQGGMGMPYFAEQKWKIGKERGFSYDGSVDFVPHDARQRSWTSTNLDGTARQRLEDMKQCKLNPQLVPNHARIDGIYAARKTIGRSWFDHDACKEGIDCLKNYMRLWDADRKIYANQPFHNWAENGASAFRYGAIAWKGIQKPEVEEKGKMVVFADAVGRIRTGLTFDELRNRNASKDTNPNILPGSMAGRSFIEARERNAKRRRQA